MKVMAADFILIRRVAAILLCAIIIWPIINLGENMNGLLLLVYAVPLSVTNFNTQLVSDYVALDIPEWVNDSTKYPLLIAWTVVFFWPLGIICCKPLLLENKCWRFAMLAYIPLLALADIGAVCYLMSID